MHADPMDLCSRQGRKTGAAGPDPIPGGARTALAAAGAGKRLPPDGAGASGLLRQPGGRICPGDHLQQADGRCSGGGGLRRGDHGRRRTGPHHAPGADGGALLAAVLSEGGPAPAHGKAGGGGEGAAGLLRFGRNAAAGGENVTQAARSRADLRPIHGVLSKRAAGSLRADRSGCGPAGGERPCAGDRAVYSGL